MPVQILGSIQVEHGDDIVVPRPRLARVLLATLALRANRSVPTGAVIDALWEGHPPTSARSNLRSYLAELRRRLAPESEVSISVTTAGFVLRAPIGALDSLEFLSLVAQGRDLLAQGRPAESTVRLTRALELWRGPALGEDRTPEALQSEVHALDMRRQAALEYNVDARLALAEHHELTFELTALLGERPVRERLYAQLMIALFRSGRQVESLDVYQQLRARLKDDLGVLPSFELQQLHRRILNADLTLYLSPSLAG